MKRITLTITDKTFRQISTRLQGGITIEEFCGQLVTDAVEPKTVTGKDIAREARVSLQAVSFALNGHQNQLSPETFRKIRAIAKRKGYYPSSTARNLRKKRS